jgi:hypothetical protein
MTRRSILATAALAAASFLFSTVVAQVSAAAQTPAPAARTAAPTAQAPGPTGQQPAPTAAQAPPATPNTPAPEAKKEDVASMDAILAALYDVISGPAGQARDWNRFRSLFAPGARLIPTGRTPEGNARITVSDPEGYITRSSAALSQGFFEKEISRQVDRFGAIAHVFSTYEARRKADDTQLLARGINSIQLFNDGTRWWIVSIYWQAERPDTQIPAEYLPK